MKKERGFKIVFIFYCKPFLDSTNSRKRNKHDNLFLYIHMYVGII